MKKLIPLLLIAFNSSYGVILLEDDFNDGSIDPAKWSTTLANGSSAVSESGGFLTTQARGILGSVNTFAGSYSIAGSFAMQDGLEHFNVTFRTDLSDTGVSGERNGVFVSFSNDGDQISIQKFDDGTNEFLAVKNYTLTTGQFYSFEIIDDGTNVSLSVDGVEELTGSDTFTSGGKIGFYSREFSGSSTQIDSITVSTVPEPSMYALVFGLFAAGSIGLNRTKRKSLAHQGE